MEIEPREDDVPPGGGLGTCAHALPSQCSTNVGPPDPFELPTAHTLSEEIPDTAVRVALVAPAGRGTGTLDHECPFQCDARGRYPL
jgi:hypothetical protein